MGPSKEEKQPLLHSQGKPYIIMNQMRWVQVNTMEGPSAPYIRGMPTNSLDMEVEVSWRYQREVRGLPGPRRSSSNEPQMGGLSRQAYQYIKELEWV